MPNFPTRTGKGGARPIEPVDSGIVPSEMTGRSIADTLREEPAVTVTGAGGQGAPTTIPAGDPKLTAGLVNDEPPGDTDGQSGPSAVAVAEDRFVDSATEPPALVDVRPPLSAGKLLTSDEAVALLEEHWAKGALDEVFHWSAEYIAAEISSSVEGEGHLPSEVRRLLGLPEFSVAVGLLGDYRDAYFRLEAALRTHSPQDIKWGLMKARLGAKLKAAVAEGLKRAYLRHPDVVFKALSYVAEKTWFGNVAEFLEDVTGSKIFFQHFTGSLIQNGYPTLMAAGAVYYLVAHLLKKYASGYGLDTYLIHDPVIAAGDVLRLAGDYDVFVPIAKKGLMLGVISRLFGLKTIAIDVHTHDVATPTARFLDGVRPEDIEGKRILLLDDDAAYGGTVEKAVKLLAPYKPAKVDVYLTAQGDFVKGSDSQREIFERNNVRLHAPTKDADILFNALVKLQEALSIPAGRIVKVVKDFKDIFFEAAATSEDAGAVMHFVKGVEELFFSVNQTLPGGETVRARMVNGLESFFGTVLVGIGAFGIESALTSAANIARSAKILPTNFYETLAIARYGKRAHALEERLGVTNERVPISYTAAFRNAQGAVKDGYDVALIVGPEGIAYAPMFEDLGIETLVINIPEDSPDGPRTFTALSDLERLRGKRVLVVEDDVVSGATLRKILEETAPFSPASFGLFLGYPGQQMLGNVPGEFEKVYTTSVDSDKDEAVFGEFLNEHEPVFKKQVQGLINPQTGSSGTLPGE